LAGSRRTINNRAMSAERVRVEVLGPFRVWDGEGGEVLLSGLLQRRLFASLVLRRRAVVTVDAAVEALWRSELPRDPTARCRTTS
jgi:DNA-binding SARP family transcriptional activator